MRIGIDLDGVVFDSEKDFRIYQELYDFYELEGKSIKNEKEVRLQERFNWTDEVINNFLDRYYVQVVKEANYMPGAKMIIRKLKEGGHELIIVTARGGNTPDIIELTEERLERDNMNIFDKACYGIVDKAEECKKENIDLMIDDSNVNCKNTSSKNIKTIYLKDAPSYEMEENEYLKVLYNWGEIYRYIKEMENLISIQRMGS